ncbi:hypothetical protein DFH27DRAFT_609607 [Peziza echinospora]|nr:hypothetical protein DFH27DRAFT_609607 [Peziza echinospora]
MGKKRTSNKRTQEENVSQLQVDRETDLAGGGKRRKLSQRQLDKLQQATHHEDGKISGKVTGDWVDGVRKAFKGRSTGGGNGHEDDAADQGQADSAPGGDTGGDGEHPVEDQQQVQKNTRRGAQGGTTAKKTKKKKAESTTRENHAKRAGSATAEPGRYNMRSRIPKSENPQIETTTQKRNIKTPKGKPTLAARKKGHAATSSARNTAARAQSQAQAAASQAGNDERDSSSVVYDDRNWVQPAPVAGNTGASDTPSPILPIQSISPASTTSSDLNNSEAVKNADDLAERHEKQIRSLNKKSDPRIAFNDANQWGYKVSPPPLAMRILTRFAQAVTHGIATIPWQLESALTETQPYTGSSRDSLQLPPEFFPGHIFTEPPASISDREREDAILGYAEWQDRVEDLWDKFERHGRGKSGDSSNWANHNSTILEHIHLSTSSDLAGLLEGNLIQTIRLKERECCLDSKLAPAIKDRDREKHAVKHYRITHMLALNHDIMISEARRPSDHLPASSIEVLKSILSSTQTTKASAIEITDKALVILLPMTTVNPYGSYGNGALNTMGWAAAILTSWNNLRKSLGDLEPELPPLPWIVTVGHDWYLHWSFWQEGKEMERDGVRQQEVTKRWIAVAGPYHMGSALTLYGKLKILDILRRLKEWFLEGLVDLPSREPTPEPGQGKGKGRATEDEPRGGAGRFKTRGFENEKPEPGLLKMLLDLMEKVDIAVDNVSSNSS